MEAVFDLYSARIDSDPFPGYALLRERYPCYWSDSNGLWILSRYDDVARAAQDWHRYSSTSGNMIDELPGRAGATLGTTDPPRHDRLRALVQKAFGRTQLEYLNEPARELAQIAIGRILQRREFDFVTDFASHVTVGILFRMLGLPQRDAAQIRRNVVLSVSTDKHARGRTNVHIQAFKELGDFISEQVTQRRAAPRDDLVTALAEAQINGDRLSEREVVLTTATFVMAGVESLSSFMSMLALNLSDYPRERHKVLSNSTLLTSAIEESLRFNTSAQRFKRVLTEDVELHGEIMRKGDKVALAYGAANRDPRKFAHPDIYDVERNSRAHLGFGAGPHFCLGSHMARLVTATAMHAFLEAVPNFERSQTQLDWLPSSNFRSPVSLPFRVLA